MMDISKMEKRMEKEKLFLKMETDMKVIGKITNYQGKVNTIFSTGTILRANFITVFVMERELILMKMAINTQAHGKMI